MFRKQAAEPLPFDQVEDLACRAEFTVPSAAKVVAYNLINTENRTVGESKLFALVDAVACVLAHEGREETARLAFESVVGSAVALAAVRVLTENDRAV